MVFFSSNKCKHFVFVGILEQTDGYKHKIPTLIQTKMNDSTNYVGSLITLCLQRKLPEPK